MNFDFTDEQKLFADAVRKFAVAHLEKDSLARAHDARFPFDVAALMSRQGLLGITLPEADGGQGGTLMDAVIAIEQVASACPRSADVVQSGNFGPIRTFAEYASPALKAKYLPALLEGRAVMSLGMIGARRRLGGDRPRHHRADRRRRGRRQRHQGVLHLQRRRFGVPDLCAVRPGGARHRLGDRRARRAGFPHRQAVALHERRGMVRAPFRRLPDSGGERAARPRRLQEADRRLQRRAHRQCGARARASAAMPSPRRATTWRRACSSAGRCANSRACSGSSPTWRSSSKARSSCSIAPLPMPTTACPRPTRPRSPRRLQPRRLRGRARGGAGDGRGRLQPGLARRILHAALPRLDDRWWLGGNPEEPHRRRNLRPPVRSTGAPPSRCRRIA